MPTFAAIARASTAAVAAFNGTMQPGYTFHGYQYLGTWAFETCYMELQGARVLPDYLWVKNGMTLDMCTSYCATNGKYKYAGVENGNECFCGNKMTPGAKNANDLDCSMTCDIPCPGNDKQICGGNGVITVYKNTV
ncbi:hypothetical protein Daus18300_002605 [Diaporthe australafricana]|uniref:WSC domain-containing protein n=1 Tax=Diaporthe australafricana TaxID=127596 RepID=A0ABR3XLY0_9PEZI